MILKELSATNGKYNFQGVMIRRRLIYRSLAALRCIKEGFQIMVLWDLSGFGSVPGEGRGGDGK